MATAGWVIFSSFFIFVSLQHYIIIHTPAMVSFVWILTFHCRHGATSSIIVKKLHESWR